MREAMLVCDIARGVTGHPDSLGRGSGWDQTVPTTVPHLLYFQKKMKIWILIITH